MALTSAQSLDEIEHIATPLKGDKKASLANKARKLGLQDAADELLNNKGKVYKQGLNKKVIYPEMHCF